ncbi:MAG: hypothetical protein ABI406_02215 [Ktedonobacteraceae bacterium]
MVAETVAPAVDYKEPVHRAAPAALQDFVVQPLHTDWIGWPVARQWCQHHNSYKSVALREPSYRMPGRDDLMSVPSMFTSWIRQFGVYYT